MTIDSLVKEVESLNQNICVEVTDGEIRVGGKTYSVRYKLKALGFQWNPESKEWYYLDPLGKKALSYNDPLPIGCANDVDLYLALSLESYTKIAKELGTSARVTAILGNLTILFTCGEIRVDFELTETLKRFVDVVPAKEANLEGYGIETVYKLKPEFEKYFGDNSSDEVE